VNPSDCASGFCFDGICCGTDCSAACWSCALVGTVGTCVPAEVGSDPRQDCPDDGLPSCRRDGACDGSGACRRYPLGAICRQPTCRGSTLTQAFRCDGVGSCALTSGQPCDPYLCDGNAQECLFACASSADCVPGRVCANGRCGRSPFGAPCAIADDCNSGFCQQGVCCASVCNGTCRSCALPGSAGTCTAVPRGQDPLTQCSDQTAALCGTDGTCDGAGACQLYVASTACSPPNCAGSLFTATRSCDGIGACRPPVVTDCGLYQCGATGCKTSCTVTADCTPPYVCTGTTCGAPTNLELQYLCRATNATEQAPRPQFQIINLATTPVPLSELTIRYWYTVDGTRTQSAAIDYANVGSANVTTTFVPLAPPRPLADFYVQLGFTAAAGTVAGGGASTGQIQLRFNKTDFTLYNQSNDYSFDPTKATVFTNWDRVTLYRNGVLAWGIEP
jgi:Cellulose binding domain